MSRALRRLAWTLTVVWAVVSIAFFVEAWLPGDPARLAAGPQARPADVARIRGQLGLDQAPAVRYERLWTRLVHVGPRDIDRASAEHATCSVVLAFGTSALHVDLGLSYLHRQPVARLLAERAPRTLALACAGLVFELAFGIAAGLGAAMSRRAWLDRAITRASLFGMSVPVYVVGLLLQYVFAYRLRLLPLDGFGATWREHAASLVLPAATLAVYGAPFYVRLARDEVREALAQDWARTARAKGVPRWRLAVVHALRAVAAPIAAAAATDFGALAGGAIVTESVFRWPGLGDLAVKATLGRDGPVIVGCVIVTAIAVVVANLAADAACALLDARLR